MPLGWEGRAEVLLSSAAATPGCFSSATSEKILTRQFCDNDQNTPPSQFHSGSIFSHKVVMTPKEGNDTLIIVNGCDLTLKAKAEHVIFMERQFLKLSVWKGHAGSQNPVKCPRSTYTQLHAALPVLSHIIPSCQGRHWLPRRCFSYTRTNRCFSLYTCKQ